MTVLATAVPLAVLAGALAAVLIPGYREARADWLARRAANPDASWWELSR